MNHPSFLSKANNSLPILTTVLLLFMLQLSASADNIITTGSTLKILPGTSMVSVEAMVIKSGATLDNSGYLILRKGLTNENTSPNSLGSGTAEFSGAFNQTISGQNIIQNLWVNNATGVTVGGNTNVNGNLTLTTGNISLGPNNLVLGASSVIVGTPSASAMIIVTSSGELRKEFQAGLGGTFTYPVGDDTGTPEYSPVTLAFNTATFAAANYAGVSLKNIKYPDPNIIGNYLNRYWNISQIGISNLNCNATFQYLAADVTGDENLISCIRVNLLPWVIYALANPVTHILSADGIYSFGAYTGVKSSGIGVETVVKNQFFKVYPNPTTDIVIIEVVDGSSTATANVTVYNMQDGKIYQKDLDGDSKFQFSLAGRPVGVYMLKVQSG
ncbi:MAG: T9SS type A sorting domain-containing protein, partial [Bacteroidota bacterium]